MLAVRSTFERFNGGRLELRTYSHINTNTVEKHHKTLCFVAKKMAKHSISYEFGVAAAEHSAANGPLGIAQH